MSKKPLPLVVAITAKRTSFHRLVMQVAAMMIGSRLSTVENVLFRIVGLAWAARAANGLLSPVRLALCALLIVALLMDNDQSNQQKAEKRSDIQDAPTKGGRIKARLELARKGSDDDLLLTITLRNTGRLPITVDRELVFGLGIEVIGQGSLGIPLERVPSPRLAPLTPERARKRLVSLPHGKHVSRTIRLNKGWKRLVVGQGRASLKTPAPLLLTAYEEVVRVPDDAVWQEIRVTHGPAVSGAFSAYMGVAARDDAHFWKPLTKTIKRRPGASLRTRPANP